MSDNVLNIEMTSVVVKSKIRKLPVKPFRDSFYRIPRNVKKKMKKRLGILGYNYWYHKYFKKNFFK